MSYNVPNSCNLVFLASTTASNSANISFMTQITTNFTTYQVLLRDIVVATNNTALTMLFSTNAGISYLNSAYQYAVQISKSGNTNTVINSTAATSIQLTPPLSSTTSQAFSGNLYLHAFDQGTQCPKLFGWGVMQDSASSNFFNCLITGMNSGTTAVNAIQFLAATGNISSGIITLYGVKEP